MTLPTTLDWRAADVAYTGLRDQYIAFCVALGELNMAGATHEQIAERYDLSRTQITKAIAIGRDERIVRIANNMPKSSETLYLMTTLDDTDFEALASPDTTRQKVLDHRDKDKAPKAPISPSDKRSDPEGEVTMLKVENDKLKAENGVLKTEIAKLKAKIDSQKANILILNAEIVNLKAKPETPEPVKAKAEAKPVKSKPETPEPITDRNAKIVELHCMAKAHWAKLDPDYQHPEIDAWIKDVFLAHHHLPKDIRDLPSFKEKSIANKIAYFSDTSFAKLCATTVARYPV